MFRCYSKQKAPRLANSCSTRGSCGRTECSPMLDLLTVPLSRWRSTPVSRISPILTGPSVAVSAGHLRRCARRRNANRRPVRRLALASRALTLSALGLDPTRYSGHSLRSGFATSAAVAGVPTWKIKAQTGHVSDVVLGRYIRDGELLAG